nr:tropomyosin-like [Aegilops tauschii subsp. strangulata]
MSDNFPKLQVLHRTRKEKLDSRAAVVDAVEADLKKCVEQMQFWFDEAWQELKTSREQLGQLWDKLLLKQSDVEKAQEEAAQQATKQDAQLRERRVLLDAHEEDLAAHEEALAAKLRGKDEEVEKLVAQQTQGLEQEHKEAFDALVLDHVGKLKEAVNAAEAAEATKNDLAGKVGKLEADLEKLGKEISTLKSDREKTMYTLAELQTTISNKTQQLSSANDTIGDLKLKLTTLKESLEGSRAREKTLAKDLQEEKQLLESVAATYNDYVKGVGIWTEHLIDVAERLTKQLSIMGLSNFRFPHKEMVTSSTRQTMFFEALLDALKLLHSSRAT